MMVFSYNGWLVALSVVISMMSAFTGLSLTRGISALSVGQRQVRIIMAAITLGGGIWSMHFVAMLAMRFPALIYYKVIETIASALIAILISGLALLLLHFRRRTKLSILAAGTILGLGIVVMHYVGLSAIEGCIPVYDPVGYGVATGLAVVMGVVAVRIAYGERSERSILLATLVFGASVAVVHFAGMAWTGFLPAPTVRPDGPAMTNPEVAIVVLFCAFVISGAFLVSGATFVNRMPLVIGVLPGVPSEAERLPSAPMPASAPERKLPETSRLPYEKDGKTYLVGFDKVAAIRADGHYTAAYLESGQVFCPWSITQAAQSVPAGFVRVHRSWLVNIDLVAGFERGKDNGWCLMQDVRGLDRVPVSRAQMAAVREALGL